MASIGFLGCGKIGKAMIRHIQARKDHSIAFVQDPFFQNDCEVDCRVVPQKRTIVYEGRAKDACELYPRNVNVHAAVALAGLGFEETQSRIISDPAVHTNSHNICVEGEGVSFRLAISTFASGDVTGSYTPISACGSLDRILEGEQSYQFV
jgi:predicted dinucleotide-utilizing enzyme